MDNIPDAIYFKDIDGKFLRVNRAQANRLRVKNQKEAIGKTDFDFFNQEDAQTSTDDENEIIRTGKVLIEERKKKKFDGGDEWLLATKLPLYDEEGKIIGTFGMTRVITEHKRSERLMQSLNQASLALENIFTPKEVFLSISSTLKELGFETMVLLLHQNGRELCTKYFSFDSKLLNAVEKLLGIRHESFSFCFDGQKPYRDAVLEKKTSLIQDVEGVLRGLLPKPVNRFAGRIVKMLNVPKTMISPIVVKDKVIGVFTIMSDDLSVDDSPIVTAFARLVGASWHKALLFQQAQQEIIDRKNAEEQIRNDLKEKTLLLSEIHHRVKNNLQVVDSLLYLQSQQLKEKHIINLLNQSRNRIYMMALVHEKLYHTKNFTSIDFKEYLEDVLTQIFKSSEICQRVNFQMEVKNVVLGIDDAIPAALIINELFTNSIKHAFPGDKKGTVQITFNLLDEDTFQLIFQDNGIGLPEGINFDTTATLGLHLVKMLAKQINGEATFDQGDWTTFKIIFKGYDYGKKKYSNR